MCWARLTRDIWVIGQGDVVYIRVSLTNATPHSLHALQYTTICFHSLHIYCILPINVSFNMDLALVQKRDQLCLYVQYNGLFKIDLFIIYSISAVLIQLPVLPFLLLSLSAAFQSALLEIFECAHWPLNNYIMAQPINKRSDVWI